MLRIRLQRIGRRNYAAFRIVVTEHTRAPKSGKFIERLGSYDPNKDQVILKDDRIKHWLSVGAKPTDVVYNLLVKGGIIEGKLKNVLPKKTPIKKDSEDADNSSTNQEGSVEGDANTSDETQNEKQSSDESNNNKEPDGEKESSQDEGEQNSGDKTESKNE